MKRMIMNDDTARCNFVNWLNEKNYTFTFSQFTLKPVESYLYEGGGEEGERKKKTKKEKIKKKKG